MDFEPLSSMIDKLNATNFHAWKQKMHHILALKDLSDLIEDDPHIGTELVIWKKKDIKGQAIIGLTLSDELLENVREVTSTTEMCHKICDAFERHTLLNKFSARPKFYTATKREEETTVQFSNRIRQLASTLKSINVLIDESEMVMAMLNGLPEVYDPLISALDAVNGAEEEKLKFNYAKSRVMQEEQRVSIRNDQAATRTQETAFISTEKAPGTDRPTCYHCGKVGYVEPKCWKKCPHLNPHKKRSQTAFVTGGDAAHDPSVGCLVSKHSEYSHHMNTHPEDSWVIDSGCSCHMTHDKSTFY